MNDLTLPDPASAQLPANYEAAKTALAECVRVDECQDWADKMAALASYARQIENKELENHCKRIQARAVRRVGELLREVEPSRGGRPSKTNDGDVSSFSRKQAARDAGLSERQQVTALRVANVPEDDFDAAVDSDDPPTTSALAEQGREPREPPLVDLGGRSPEDFAAATKLMGLVTRFIVEAETLDLEAACRGFTDEEREEVARRIGLAIGWLRATVLVIAKVAQVLPDAAEVMHKATVSMMDNDLEVAAGLLRGGQHRALGALLNKLGVADV